jgi:hypothetical protein
MNYSDKFKISSPLMVILFLLLLALQGLIHTSFKKPPISISKQNSSLNFDNTFLKFSSFGHHRFIADLLWITTLIESDLEHYKKDDLNSWMYLRFNTITDLDEKRYYPYSFGARYLSIIKDDLKGAEKIFLKGLEHFQDDYQLNYNLAFLYIFEKNEVDKSVPFLGRIKDHPKAPPFIISLLSKAKAQAGFDLKEVYLAVKSRFDEAKDERVKAKLEAELYALKAEIDLECLNTNQDNCERFDLDGNAYIFKKGKYQSQKQYKPYRIKIKKGRN